MTAVFFGWAAAGSEAAASAIPTKVLMSMPTKFIGATGPAAHTEPPPEQAAQLWEPLMLQLSAPADASFASIVIAVEPGATVDLFALSLR